MEEIRRSCRRFPLERAPHARTNVNLNPRLASEQPGGAGSTFSAVREVLAASGDQSGAAGGLPGAAM